MALTLLEDTNGVAGTTSATPAALTGTGPSGSYTIADGDLAYIYAVNKASTITPSTPSGWTSLASVAVGTGTAGAGTGPVRLTVFQRAVSGGSLTIPTISHTGSVIVAGLLLLRPGAGETVTHTNTSGSDTTSGTGWSVAGAANLSATAGDFIVAVNGMTNNGSNMQTDGSQSISMSGVTAYGASTELTDSQGSGGNRCQLVVSSFPVTTGTSTGVPTYAATLTAANTGGCLFIRVRAAGAVTPVIDAGADVTGWTVGTTFTRTGTATNSPTSQAWTITAGPAGVSSTIGTALTLAWSPMTVGSYTLQLAASNANGAGTPDTMTIDVVNPSTGGGTTTPTVRSVSSGTEAAGSNSVAVSSPPGLQAGDYILAVHSADADNTVGGMSGPFPVLSSSEGNGTSNIPPVEISGRIASASDASAGSFTFTSTFSTGGASIVLVAFTAGSFDTTTPVTMGTYTTQARTSTTTQTAPSMTGLTGALLLAVFATEANGVAQAYPASGPSGMTYVDDQNSSDSYALCGVYSQALSSSAATGAKSVSPTPSSTTNGWAATLMLVNPSSSGGGSASGRGSFFLMT